MKSTNLEFEGSHGDILSARVDEPDSGNIKGSVLFAHCFTCSKNLSAIGHISRALTSHGLLVFRFDFTGLGESEGDFSKTNFSSNVDDLIAAAKFMEKKWNSPSILMGHSLGGAAVLQASSSINSVEAVVTIAAPYNPEHVTHLIMDSLDEINAKGKARVKISGRVFTIKKQFLDDLDEISMKNKIRHLDKALLIFHSPIDNVVGISNAEKIYVAAKHPKSFISLDDADHMLSNDEDAKYVGAVTAAWADRYI